MVNLIPEFVTNIWSKFDVRIAVLTSLLLQILLIFLAPWRKCTKNSMVLMVLWLSYLIADYTANFGVGLISNKFGDKSNSNMNDLLIVFWAPFLLLHLGGPDTITAFSLEDNELWLRHMLGLITQVCLTGYIFLLSLPTNKLWLPTTLVYLSGFIKFAERTRSLQLASASNFRSLAIDTYDFEESLEYQLRMEATPDTGAAIEKNEYLDDVELVRRAYYLFNKFKGLVADITLDPGMYGVISDYFKNLTAVDALRVIEVELNFFYEAFYTKAMVLHSKLGFFFRFVSVSSVVVALVLFTSDQKHGFNEFDVRVTYTLLYGAVALDVVSLLMLSFSDHTFASFYSLDSDENDCFRFIRKLIDFMFGHFLKLKRPKWLGPKQTLRRQIWCRRWCESMSGFNFISYCLPKRKRWAWVEKSIGYIGAGWVEQWTYEEKNPVVKELWLFIFRELQRKHADAIESEESKKRVESSRGAWAIDRSEMMQDVKVELMNFVDSNQYSFDDSLIHWHIATDILFYGDNNDIEEGSKNVDDENDELDGKSCYRDMSKVISDYMLYLLILQPTMMSKQIGFEEIWETTCGMVGMYFEDKNIMAEEKNLPSINRSVGEFSKFIGGLSSDNLDVSVSNWLYPAGRLTETLKTLRGMKKWKMIAEIWVEMLSYAALNCNAITHIRQLAQGGEFISLLWVSMAHFCLGKPFKSYLKEVMVPDLSP